MLWSMGKKFLDQPVKQWWLHIWLFTRVSLFQKHYKLIAVDLSKQQALDADSKATQQISFTRNLDRDEDALKLFIIDSCCI